MPLIDESYLVTIKNVVGVFSSYLWHINTFSQFIASPHRMNDCSKSCILLSAGFTDKGAAKE